MDHSTRTHSGHDAVPDEQTADAGSLLSAALACAAAADAYVAADRWYAQGLVLMLLGRAFEFALKAHAVRAGATADVLRYRLGSDLDVNLRHGLEHGLDVDGGLHTQDWSALRALDRVLKDMRTKYTDTGGDLPDGAELRRLLARVLTACRISVRGQASGGSSEDSGEMHTGAPVYRAAEPAEPADTSTRRRPLSEQSD